jgi:hypothetical protein
MVPPGAILPRRGLPAAASGGVAARPSDTNRDPQANLSPSGTLGTARTEPGRAHWHSVSSVSGCCGFAPRLGGPGPVLQGVKMPCRAVPRAAPRHRDTRSDHVASESESRRVMLLPSRGRSCRFRVVAGHGGAASESWQTWPLPSRGLLCRFRVAADHGMAAAESWRTRILPLPSRGRSCRFRVAVGVGNQMPLPSRGG